MFNLLPVIVTVGGGYMLIKLRFFFVLHPFKTIKKAYRGVKSKEAFSSLNLALAGTLGIGNILGVAFGLLVGGAGTLFWMLLSCLFSSALKYSEALLSFQFAKHKKDGLHGGFYNVLFNTGGTWHRKFAKTYSVCIVLLALVMGGALQSGTAVLTCSEIFNTPPNLIAVLFTLFVLFALFGGVKIIEKITAFVIPLSTIVYIALTLSVICINFRKIPFVICEIFESAFSFKSATSGIASVLISNSLSEGYKRGLMSNEAGAGTSSMAHVKSGILNGGVLGLMGIVEVLFDTVFLCTLTGLTILLSVDDISIFISPIQLILSAFGNSMGSFSVDVLLFLLFAFAYSTVICWYFYGEEALQSLSMMKCKSLFRLVFLGFVLFGFSIPQEFLILSSDFFFLIATILCVFAIIKNSDTVKAVSEKSGILNLKIKDSVFSKECDKFPR